MAIITIIQVRVKRARSTFSNHFTSKPSKEKKKFCCFKKKNNFPEIFITFQIKYNYLKSIMTSSNSFPFPNRFSSPRRGFLTYKRSFTTKTSIVKIDAKEKGPSVHEEISRRNIVRKNCDNESETRSFADNLLTYGHMPGERQ